VEEKGGEGGKGRGGEGRRRERKGDGSPYKIPEYATGL